MDDEINQVEALLFASGKFMNEENLSLLTGIDKKAVKKHLAHLKQTYDDRAGSLMLVHDQDSWKINVRENYMDLVRKIVADTELPKSVLETLAVIAWKSPALQSTVIKTRGNKGYEHIAQLEEMGFVTKTKEGRSYKLKVSEKFFEYFDVPGTKDLKDMFKEIKVAQNKKEKEQQEEGEEQTEQQTSLEEQPSEETEAPQENNEQVGETKEKEIIAEKETSPDELKQKQSEPSKIATVQHEEEEE